jgi:hypothetical protein
MTLAEKEGFEPPIPWIQNNGFQDRRIRPLCHFSKLVIFLFICFQDAAPDSYRDDRSAISPNLLSILLKLKTAAFTVPLFDLQKAGPFLQIFYLSSLNSRPPHFPLFDCQKAGPFLQILYLSSLNSRPPHFPLFDLQKAGPFLLISAVLMRVTEGFLRRKDNIFLIFQIFSELFYVYIR